MLWSLQPAWYNAVGDTGTLFPEDPAKICLIFPHFSPIFTRAANLLRNNWGSYSSQLPKTRKPNWLGFRLFFGLYFLNGMQPVIRKKSMSVLIALKCFASHPQPFTRVLCFTYYL